MAGHILMVGTTGCGKTTLARKMAQRAADAGRPVLVYDPVGGEWPHAARVFDDEYEYGQEALRSRGALYVVDEAGELLGRSNHEFFWLVTRARHKGAQTVLICHRPSQLANVLRDNCSHLVLFRSTLAVAKLMADEFNDPRLEQATRLERHAYLTSSR